MLDMDDFVGQHERALHNFALQLTRSEDDADDLLQDTWIKCLVQQQLLGSITPQKQRSWLFTVLKNRWLDVCRHRKLERMVNSQTAFPAFTAAPDHRLELHLEKLPELERQIVQLRYWEGSNSKQIATELGIPEGTVRWRLKLALEKLRNYMQVSDKEERCLL